MVIKKTKTLNPAGIVRSALVCLQHRSNTQYIESSEGIAYLNGLSEPADLIARSYCQYLCQMKRYRTISRLLLDTIAVAGFFYLLTCRGGHTVAEKHTAVFLNDDMGIIPSGLYRQFSDIKRIEEVRGFSSSETSDALLVEIRKRYKHDVYFKFKCALKLHWYDSLVEKYSPNVILSTCEYSFTSSILTEYCRRRGIQHINVMHGEKWLDIHDSFFAFDRCYVWDDYYIQLFETLRCPREQFVVAVPEALLFTHRNHVTTVYDYVYYLQDEDAKTLRRIADEMRCLKATGARVAFRLHPRYSIRNAEKFLVGFPIEKPTEVPIEQSVLQTRFAVSLCSTVLQQAYLNGVGVVIDDLTSPEQFSRLAERKYMMLQKPHRLLSDLLHGEVVG